MLRSDLKWTVDYGQGEYVPGKHPALPESPVDCGDHAITHVEAGTMTSAEFAARFDATRTPVVIHSATAHWPAKLLWSPQVRWGRESALLVVRHGE